jgi:hypothetical protein
MVRDDVGETVEPPERELREDPALVRDLRRQHPVVHGDAVGRDHDQVAGLVAIEVADLARVQVQQARNLDRLGFLHESGHVRSPFSVIP